MTKRVQSARNSTAISKQQTPQLCSPKRFRRRLNHPRFSVEVAGITEEQPTLHSQCCTGRAQSTDLFVRVSKNVFHHCAPRNEIRVDKKFLQEELVEKSAPVNDIQEKLHFHAKQKTRNFECHWKPLRINAKHERSFEVQ